ncbi:hypothetical protein CesoFtcFv8_015596 [Champsocephalus esox]|uniref:Uncharacterized protein n=1 Tax=Champsocephalus esox TaxID=159716 RepID=A0AAN8BSZ7_9TELE|nr:hypothetical protein CesoFtcFv8_015596 [Champsocephalus esox]
MHQVSVSFSVGEKEIQAFSLSAGIERVAVEEHRTPFVTREEEESLHRDSCSFPTLPAYERSQRHRYSHHLPPASHREHEPHMSRLLRENRGRRRVSG